MIAPAEKMAAAEPPPLQRPGLAPASALPAPSSARPPSLTPAEKERAERLVANGDKHLEQGNIGAARLFYQRAAEAGLAAGAIKMAATFDPTELERQNVKVQGVSGDRAEARKWYERARTLGAPEADERLARIGGS
jgi:TPR repeat protein